MNCEVIVEGQLVELKRNFYKFGRSSECEIKSTNKSVSRFACTLYQLEGGQWCVIDGNAGDDTSRNRNGIKINGRSVNASDGILLNHGDIVEFSPDSFLQFFKNNEKDIDLQATFSNWRSA